MVLVLLAASPILSIVVRLPSEPFSELSLLGPGHLAEGYPFNMTEEVSYSVLVGITNHLGGLENYRVELKFRNQTESLPNATLASPSSLGSLYEYPAFLSDNETWERNVTFSFSGVSFGSNSCRVSNLNVEGYSFFVNKTATWDTTDKGYFFELFFELWLYDTSSSGFVYHNRFVSLWLNMTKSSMF